MIGLSFSLCVYDIATGKIPYNSVLVIIARTRFTDDDEFNELITRRRKDIWRDYPAECERIARELRIEGKLRQRQLTGKSNPRFRVGCHWAKDEDTIRFTTVPSPKQRVEEKVT